MNTTKKAIKLLTVLAVAILASCESLPDHAQPVSSLKASDWNVSYSLNMPDHPSQDGQWLKLLLKQDQSRLCYLTRDHSTPLSGKITADVSLDADSAVVLDYLTEPFNAIGDPASVSLLINNDHTTEYGRWWSKDHPALVNRKNVRVEASFIPSDWISVFGKAGDLNKETKEAFNKAITNTKSVGLTFGGGYFRGHGLTPRHGDATIKIKSFTIKK